MSTFEIPPEHDFDDQFESLLQGLHSIFSVDGSDDGKMNDVAKVVYAEQRLKEFRARAKERVDQAREDLRAIARDHKQAELASQRSSAHPTTQAHEAKMTSLRQSRLTKMKANSELEQQVYRLQGELERLQQELKDEEAEAVDAMELNSEVLRIKLYRDMGFIPVEENGIYSKIVVRSQNSRDARTVQLDSSTNDYKWSEFLWDLVSR
ncbi:hypothetical protein RTG_01511 [Rhodotorula toruloides ATCC 204091]|uniref:Kinetochore protein Spc24 n=1 Tax=Rhodotorula toruloides TaxID=5286 RepID=A0A0K3CG12_RHOTO|nr:hypothetical protein RTG_01511 [Rhodotorula toruloides ATCC 204091]KAK4332983.1 Kinetochore protein Spc24 [Rhodotorula toruloides]PRQ73666.1 hypothetical protein AAT19DRAFT_15233 [Rhodotorula toruloides]